MVFLNTSVSANHVSTNSAQDVKHLNNLPKANCIKDISNTYHTAYYILLNHYCYIIISRNLISTLDGTNIPAGNLILYNDPGIIS